MRYLNLLPMVALLGVPQIAATQERLDPECRREVMQLCGKTRDREVIRACLKEKSSQLSAGCRDEIKSRIGGAGRATEATTAMAAPSGNTEYKYGSDAAQALDYYPVSGKPTAPLVIFVHGGGWVIGDKGNGAGTKPAFYNSLGYAFASVNYRLVPKTKSDGQVGITPEGQATDIASAVAYLRKDAAKLGFNPDYMIIMGHSAGAHLAALVSADGRYFEKAGVPMSAVKGTVLLDGAGYDVARQMAGLSDAGRGQSRAALMYDTVFGKDPKVQKALSPIAHVASPNTAKWLILHVADRADSAAQSEALGKGLSANGASAIVKAVPGSTHKSVNQDAGSAGTFVGDAISGFLGQLQ